MPDGYVTTDADGFEQTGERVRRWPLPVATAAGFDPGELVEPDELGTPRLLDARQLVAELGEHVYVAEVVGDAGAARLVAGTGWSEPVAAGFALDCVEHIAERIGGAVAERLPGGGTVAQALADARDFLAKGTATEGHQLGFLARHAGARRLRAEGDHIGSAAFVEAARAEGEDVDTFDDPIWTTLAAAQEAIFAAIEAVRHVAAPGRAERESRRFEAREQSKLPKIEDVDTPWGRFPLGGAGPKYPPPWAAAREAAERARQAVADAAAADAAEAEALWQAEHLVSLFDHAAGGARR